MDNDFKGFDLLNEIKDKYSTLKEILEQYQELGKIRYFNEQEWEKIKKQNYTGFEDVDSFYDIFRLGYNIGHCGIMARQLSYSYNDIDIVSGKVSMLKGTLNSPNGGHIWLETKKQVIDTSLLLVFDKSLKSKIGYMDEQRLTSKVLAKDMYYGVRKEYTNDINIKRIRKNK